MEITLGILVFLVCIYIGAEAQLNDAKQYIPQQIKYDDGGPVYGGIHYKSGISREPLSNSYENSRETISRTAGSPYPQPDRSGADPSGHPQVIYYRQPESRNTYHSQPENLQLSHGPDHHRPSHASVIYPQQPRVPQPSHASLIHPQPGYQTPKVADQDYKQIYPGEEHRTPSHASLIHPQPGYHTPKVADQDHKQIYPVAEHQQPNILQPSHATSIHSEPSGPAYQSAKVVERESTPEYKNPQPPNSRVVRDPRLPLYFTMYEKRIIQDPVDMYGKGPWRYLTYGHGITYGSKEPGKVFERGYGYIRALGRDHCKNPENKCPRKDDDKPFEYEGRKEPYFGYRPH